MLYFSLFHIILALYHTIVLVEAGMSRVRMMSVAVIVAAASCILLSVHSSEALNINGHYQGTFLGTSTDDGVTENVSGPVVFDVAEPTITVTVPGPGTGTVLPTGSAEFSAVGSGSGADASCLFGGQFNPANGFISASGQWSCTFDGGSSQGTWEAASPHTDVPEAGTSTLLSSALIALGVITRQRYKRRRAAGSSRG